MILNSTQQSVQTSNPLGTTPTSRVIDTSQTTSPRSAQSKSKSDKQQEQAVEQAQMQSEQRMIRELQARDREVRAHEAAHTAAGGNLVVSGPSFTYQRGPDGRSYAIGGEVQLDVSAVPGDPEATLDKSQQIRQAALAPADPSPQDMKVAANANQMASKARIDIAIQRREEAQLEEKQDGLSAEQDQSVEASDNVVSSNETSPLAESGASQDSATGNSQNSSNSTAFEQFKTVSNTGLQDDPASIGFSQFA